MKKSSFIILISLLVVLIGVNVFLLVRNTCNCGKSSCCETNSSSQDSRTNRHNEFIKKLNLSASQEKQYEKIREEKHRTAKPIFESFTASQKVLADYLIAGNTNPKIIDSLENIIMANNKQLLTMHIKQYEQLKTILNSEQKVKFDSLFKEMFVWDRKCRVRK